MRLGLVGLILVIVGNILFLEGLWALDFAMWYRHFYVYYPWEFHVCYGCKGGKPLGVGVNIKYFQMCISLILVAIGSYLVGRSERGAGNERRSTGLVS